MKNTTLRCLALLHVIQVSSEEQTDHGLLSIVKIVVFIATHTRWRRTITQGDNYVDKEPLSCNFLDTKGLLFRFWNVWVMVLVLKSTDGVNSTGELENSCSSNIDWFQGRNNRAFILFLWRIIKHNGRYSGT